MKRYGIPSAIALFLMLIGGWAVWKMRDAGPSEQKVQAFEPSIDPIDDITKYSHFSAPGMSQSEIGEKVYVDWCEACHADNGLGLTAAWMAQWDPEHQNCWQAKCHSLDHPSDGFVIPRRVPAVVGASALADFETAADLKTYLAEDMPFSELGVLDDPAYWALTSYLLSENGIIGSDVQVNPSNASSLRLGQ